MAPPKLSGHPRGTVQNTLLGMVTYTIRAIPLPPTISEFLQAHTSSISRILSQQLEETPPDSTEVELNAVEVDIDGTADQTQSQAQDQARLLSPDQFWDEFNTICQKAGPEWTDAPDRIWSFGPKRIGSCLLLDPPGSKHLR